MSLVEKAMPISGDTFNKTLINGHFYQVVRMSDKDYLIVVSQNKSVSLSSNTISIEDDRILMFGMDYNPETATNRYKFDNATIEWSCHEPQAPYTKGCHVVSVKKTDKNKPIKISIIFSRESTTFWYTPILFE